MKVLRLAIQNPALFSRQGSEVIRPYSPRGFGLWVQMAMKYLYKYCVYVRRQLSDVKTVVDGNMMIANRKCGSLQELSDA